MNKADHFQKRMEKVQLMVIDGSAKAGELVKNILNQLGFSNVLLASNGFQGLQITRETRIDIIVTDWELSVCKPEPAANDQEEKHQAAIIPINGTMFVKRLRFAPNSPCPFVPIIMLVRSASSVDILTARDSGVDEIVAKPFEADDFCQKIINIIESPRVFVTSEVYRGPCRRRRQMPLPTGIKNRRFKEIRIIRHDEGLK